jgi:hypothetical protein
MPPICQPSSALSAGDRVSLPTRVAATGGLSGTNGGQTDALRCLQARQNRVALSPLSAEATDLRLARSYRAGDVSLPPRRVPARLGGAMSPPPRSFSGCRTPGQPMRPGTGRVALRLTAFFPKGLSESAAWRGSPSSGRHPPCAKQSLSVLSHPEKGHCGPRDYTLREGLDLVHGGITGILPWVVRIASGRG